MVAVSEGRNDTSEELRSVFIWAVDIKYTNIEFTIIDIVLSCVVLSLQEMYFANIPV